MAVKIYTESGHVFEINLDFDEVVERMDSIKKEPFIFDGTVSEGDRRVKIVMQYIVAVEDQEYE
jgi:hypothetical protein